MKTCSKRRKLEAKEDTKKPVPQQSHLMATTNNELTFNTLPIEIKGSIFSFLSLKDLSKINTVCTAWDDASQLAWREKIKQDFLYLKKDPQYCINPRVLYATEYLRFSKLLADDNLNLTMPQLLSAARDKLPKDILKKERSLLLGFAILNNNEKIDCDHSSYRESLFLAVKLGNLPLFKDLESNFLPKETLMLAINYRHPHILKYLLDKQHATFYNTLQASKALHLAVIEGCEESVSLILNSTLKLTFDAIGKALELAAKKGFPELVKYLWEYLVKLNKRKHISKINRLSYYLDQTVRIASRSGHLDIVTYFALMLSEDREFKKCCFKAALYNNQNDVAQYLLLDLNLTAKEKSFILSHCVTSGYLISIEIFLKNVPNVSPETLAEEFNNAVQIESWDIAALLIKMNPNIEAKNVALINAAELQTWNIVRNCLEEVPSDITLETKGKILELAIKHNSISTVHYLIDHGGLASNQITWAIHLAQFMSPASSKILRFLQFHLLENPYTSRYRM